MVGPGQATIMVASLLLLGACAGSTRSTRLNQRDREVLGDWLECIECANGEFDSLRAHGPALRDTLVTLLYAGAPADRKQVLRVRLAGPYALLSSTADAPGLPDSARYTNLYVALLSNRYQKRSAVALAVMGGVQGRTALERAVNDSLKYAEGLRAAIRAARDTARVRFP